MQRLTKLYLFSAILSILGENISKKERGIPSLFHVAFLPVAPLVGYHDTAVGLGTDGVGGDALLILQGGVDHMALIGVHGLQGHAAAVLQHLAGHLIGQALRSCCRLQRRSA